MKKFLTTLAVSLLMLSSFAQTNSIWSVQPPAPQPLTVEHGKLKAVAPHKDKVMFFDSAKSYFTAVNTNYNWSLTKFELATGYKKVTTVGSSMTLDGQYNITPRFSLGGAAQFSGVGSPLNALEASLGVGAVVFYDTKLEIQVRSGWDWNQDSFVVEPCIFLKKKLTQNTFVSTGLSLPWYSKGPFNNDPALYVETGFTY
jgi:hypothetical protein